jgi:hypothetical protein
MDPTDLRAGLAERLAGSEPIDAQTFNSACFMLSRALEDLALSVPEAAPLARRLLRVVGRVVIDTGEPGSDPAVWPDTEAMALQWIDEALRGLGYEVRPTPGGGRPGFYPDFPWPWLQTFPLSNSTWTSGAADCTATLYYNNGRGWKDIMSTKIQVYA